jgi:hypothetical protein
MAIKGGQQLSMSAPAPKPAQQAAPEQKGEEKKGDDKEKPADKPAPKDDAPPPPPEMKIEPLKADTFANIPNFTPPPPPPAAAPPPPPAATPQALDNMIQRVQDNVNREQLDPSPTGG